MVQLTEDKWRNPESDPLLALEFTAVKWGLAVPGAEQFLKVEGEDWARAACALVRRADLGGWEKQPRIRGRADSMADTITRITTRGRNDG